MEKVSVIIPVYNVEKYLRKCLDSVINQTYQNLEIILIDDGSPDNCGDICDHYAEADNRIKVIHKKNGGLSAARNDGLKLATGKWISFIDSDDWCELDLYEKAVAAAEKENVDILIYNLFRNYDHKETAIMAFPEAFVSTDINFISKMQLSALSKFYTPFLHNWSQGFPWDKLFRASLIIDNQLTFATNVKANEDVIFGLHAFQFAKKIAYIDAYLYHYRDNPNSIGTKYTPDRVRIDRDIYKEIFAIGGKYKLSEEYYRALDSRIVENTVLCGSRCFFHKNREGSFWEKIKYANKVLHSEPVFSAFEHVDKEKLGLVSRFVLISRHHNVFLLYIASRLRVAVKKFR